MPTIQTSSTPVFCPSHDFKKRNENVFHNHAQPPIFDSFGATNLQQSQQKYRPHLDLAHLPPEFSLIDTQVSRTFYAIYAQHKILFLNPAWKLFGKLLCWLSDATVSSQARSKVVEC